MDEREQRRDGEQRNAQIDASEPQQSQSRPGDSIHARAPAASITERRHIQRLAPCPKAGTISEKAHRSKADDATLAILGLIVRSVRFTRAIASIAALAIALHPAIPAFAGDCSSVGATVNAVSPADAARRALIFCEAETADEPVKIVRSPAARVTSRGPASYGPTWQRQASRLGAVGARCLLGWRG